MPDLQPFNALHPRRDLIQAVASKSSDFDNEADLVAELNENPFSYLHVTKMPLLHPGRYLHPTDFLTDSRKFLLDLLDQGVLVEDSVEGFYIYRQTIDGTSHTGIIGLCDMEDYHNNHIKRHEYTRHDREEFISQLLEQTSVIGEPLLLSHHHKQSLEDLLRTIIRTEPDTEFEKGRRFHQIHANQIRKAEIRGKDRHLLGSPPSDV